MSIMDGLYALEGLSVYPAYALLFAVAVRWLPYAW